MTKMAETAQNVSMVDVPDLGGQKEKVHHTVTACVRCRQVRPISTDSATRN